MSETDLDGWVKAVVNGNSSSPLQKTVMAWCSGIQSAGVRAATLRRDNVDFGVYIPGRDIHHYQEVTLTGQHQPQFMEQPLLLKDFTTHLSIIHTAVLPCAAHLMSRFNLPMLADIHQPSIKFMRIMTVLNTPVPLTHKAIC
jgi:hypothetical protein